MSNLAIHQNLGILHNEYTFIGIGLAADVGQFHKEERGALFPGFIAVGPR